MGGLSPHRHTFGGETVASRVPQIEILLHRNHMYVGSHGNVCPVKSPRPDQLALAGHEFHAFLPQKRPPVGVDIFFSGYGEKRQGTCEFISDLRIRKGKGGSHHGRHLGVMPAGVRHAGDQIRFRVGSASDGVHLSDDGEIWAAL